MGLKKYKYYFKKPRSQIVKDILTWLAISGMIYIAASSPYFARNLIKAYQKRNKYPRNKNKIINTFYNLKRQGLIEFRMVGKQLYIKLTEKGKTKANWMQIDELEIKKPKKWDRKYRLAIFDISQLKKLYREVFRGKLKELGFYCLQKSVWLHVFDCRAEIELLKEFFGLSDDELRFIITNDIGPDEKVKKFFKLE